MEQCSIRILTPADQPDWLRLRRALWQGTPLHRHRLEISLLLSSQGIAFGAVASPGGLSGFIEISVRHDYVEGSRSCPVAYVEGLYVDPACENRGIARRLLRAAEDWAAAQGLTQIGSDTDLRNYHSLRTHQSAGYKVAGQALHFIKTVRRGRKAGRPFSPRSGVLIRAAGLKEIESVIRMDPLAVEGSTRVAQIEEWCRNGQLYILLENRRLAAYGTLEYTFFTCGFVSLLYVRPDARRRGLGGLLLQYLEERCRTEKLFTSTNQSNTAMQQLLTGRGYRPTGRIDNLDPGDPELFYLKLLDKRPESFL